MRQPRILLCALLLATLCLPLAPASAARYQINPDSGSEVIFISKAPLETFKGRTRQISGWFEADLADLSGEVSLTVDVDLASFDTGMKKRNTHMRENHLETDTYPAARFTAGSIVSASPTTLATGQTAQLKLQGVLDLHGVQKNLECDLTVSLEDDGSVRVAGEFPVLLSDFAIDRPKFLVMKLADEQKVQIDLRGQPSEPGEAP